MKVLSVDDSRMVHMVVTKALKPVGIDVITASNGQEGLDKARSEKPNVIVMDATMPVMNGIEALEQLKLDPSTRDIPVIMLSADAGKDNIDRAIQLGAIKFITKPFTTDGLIESLGPYLNLPAKA
jgi:two-component system, cell cycle response regulator